MKGLSPNRLIQKLTVGSLFAGIGGFDLGLERTGGFEIKWQVEIDEYCRRVLEKHWPHVKRYGDIREVADVERVDVLCGGFPCQDISNAGKREGITGERSGLWSEFARLIRLVRPEYVIVENVAALLGRGMGTVLGDLSESGYCAEWDVVPASAVGAPHRRERVWIVAYANGNQAARQRKHGGEVHSKPETARPGGSGGRIPNSDFSGLPVRDEAGDCSTAMEGFFAGRESQRILAAARSEQWAVEPCVGRVAHGIPSRVDRLKGLGNAVVPQIVEWIGNRILECENQHAQD